MGAMYFECQYCGETFAYASGLRRHINKRRCPELSSVDDGECKGSLGGLGRKTELPDYGCGRDPALARAIALAYPMTK